RAIAPALHAIADLISTMRRQMEAENHELQDFLRQLTGRLQDLDQHLAGAQTHHRASVDSSRELDAAVQVQVRHIESSVDQAENPQQLKAEIQQRLETILRHLDEHRESDEARQHQLEEQLERLNQRVREMEKEGESLRQRLREKHEQAVRDPLTGLYNRLAYDERIVQEFARAKRYKQPLSLAVLDIDRFKRINDSYGHKAGDKALKIIAERVRNNLRETDFLARYGGEEFAIVMPETCLSDGLVAVEKLRKDVSQSQFHYQGTGVAITVSVGLAEMREDDSPETLFQRADRALYQAKDSGRNCTCAEEN
ncbi:MAG TPA: GGDEF domain-containing protein, partial [Chromatiales bacterium]|nr:GGDEF domain-containing protein [Chromatiales bacterium]HEX22098.1 GGDEF domain-containing protein [Chromatiales bacterium]